MTVRRSGFTLVEIMIVVSIIGLLAVVAIPSFAKARKTSQAKVCISNLRVISGGIQQWALENFKTSDDEVDVEELKTYAKNADSINCPAGFGYIITTVGEEPQCESGFPDHKL